MPSLEEKQNPMRTSRCTKGLKEEFEKQGIKQNNQISARYARLQQSSTSKGSSSYKELLNTDGGSGTAFIFLVLILGGSLLLLLLGLVPSGSGGRRGAGFAAVRGSGLGSVLGLGNARVGVGDLLSSVADGRHLSLLSVDAAIVGAVVVTSENSSVAITETRIVVGDTVSDLWLGILETSLQDNLSSTGRLSSSKGAGGNDKGDDRETHFDSTVD